MAAPAGPPDIPPDLVSSIQDGRCVAFVGAGFAQPLMPSWHELLCRLTEDLDDGTAAGRDLQAEIRAWLGREQLSNRDFEGIAQTLQSRLPSFERSLRRALNTTVLHGRDPREHRAARAIWRSRIGLLREIPFHSILTTNFDRLMPGEVPSRDVFARVIGGRRRPWWAHRAWAEQSASGWGAPVVKLHGAIEKAPGQRKLVFTTRGYRRLVHEEPGYRAFLRTLFATHSVLYLGFSFSDAYINELRAEILSLIGRGEGEGRLRDYAVVANLPRQVAEHLAHHEGLECLSFEATDGDFGGFDAILRRIHDLTAPSATLRERVRGRRILWLDPNPHETDFGFRVMVDAAAEGGPSGARITQVSRVDEALARLDGGESCDLVISHFGFDADPAALGVPESLRNPDEGRPVSTVEYLFRGMRKLPVERQVPVIVFSERAHRTENRPIALKLGAFAFVDDWGHLFRAVQRVFAP